MTIWNSDDSQLGVDANAVAIRRNDKKDFNGGFNFVHQL